MAWAGRKLSLSSLDILESLCLAEKPALACDSKVSSSEFATFVRGNPQSAFGSRLESFSSEIHFQPRDFCINFLTFSPSQVGTFVARRLSPLNFGRQIARRLRCRLSGATRAARFPRNTSECFGC